jgi:co-chaperonin GroES (HSP10)
MPVFEPAKIIGYKYGEDPRKIVLDIILPLVKDLRLYRNEVLLVTAPDMTSTASGLELCRSEKEQRFQGKIGLVVALGEIAFNDKDIWPNEGSRPTVGTWVFFRTADTSECAIGGYSCRFINDDKVRGHCPNADSIR